jgi:hypothetical protein
MVHYLFFIYHFHNLPNHILRHAFYELPLLLPHFSRAFTPCCLHPQCRLSLAASAVGDILIVPSLLVPVLCVDGVFVPVSSCFLIFLFNGTSGTVHPSHCRRRRRFVARSMGDTFRGLCELRLACHSTQTHAHTHTQVLGLTPLDASSGLCGPEQHEANQGGGDAARSCLYMIRFSCIFFYLPSFNACSLV